MIGALDKLKTWLRKKETVLVSWLFYHRKQRDNHKILDKESCSLADLENWHRSVRFEPKTLEEAEKVWWRPLFRLHKYFLKHSLFYKHWHLHKNATHFNLLVLLVFSLTMLSSILQLPMEVRAQNTLSQQVNVKAFVAPPDLNAILANSILTANPLVTDVNGLINLSLHVTDGVYNYRDFSVQFFSSVSNGEVYTQPLALTDLSGMAIGSVTSPVAGTILVKARIAMLPYIPWTEINDTVETRFNPTGFPILHFQVYPEKRVRLANSLNLQTTARIEIRNSGSLNNLFTGFANTDSNGIGQIELTDLNQGVYDIAVKGLSHLRSKKQDVTVTADFQVDFSEQATKYVKAGDISPVIDNVVNALDISVITKQINSNDIKSDLNQDSLVNSLDISTMLFNLWVKGDD